MGALHLSDSRKRRRRSDLRHGWPAITPGTSGPAAIFWAEVNVHPDSRVTCTPISTTTTMTTMTTTTTTITTRFIPHYSCCSYYLFCVRTASWKMAKQSLHSFTVHAASGSGAYRGVRYPTIGVHVNLCQFSVPHALVKARPLAFVLLSRSVNATGSRCSVHLSLSRLTPQTRVATADPAVSLFPPPPVPL
ncbi:hypothetical protein EJ07DRAFT_151804 [Lizonia empirigonia]|nr:hypothetical protein EJ07DRAFT_151804 [Lizonia empirigonia]